MPPAPTGSSPRANFLAGEWRPARSGARFAGSSGTAEDLWPQSGGEDVALAWQAAREAEGAWRGLDQRRRDELVWALAHALEHDEHLLEGPGKRLGLGPEELRAHAAELDRELRELAARPVSAPGGIAWCAPDWRELVRAPLCDVARVLRSGGVVVLVSDARVPELAERFALAALAAGLPAGVLGLLHGERRELLALGLGAQGRCTLLASGLVSQMAELRRLEQRGLESRGAIETHLRALRCGACEVDPARALEESAAEVVERAFGRVPTLGGQLPGSLGRVFCPARLFSRFTELCLARLAASEVARAPVPQIDEEGAARVIAAWELGLDEGATCIAGGDADVGSRVLPPTIFTNVESYMASARRQDPLPVLCLLRSG